MNAKLTYFADQFGDDDLGAAAATERATAEELKKQAHLANGGEAQFPCPKCGGTGYWRMSRPCFACKGKGKVGKRVIAAAKGKETKARNLAQWAEDHAAEIAYIHSRADRWDFMANMASSLQEWGKLTDNQLAAVQRAMAKDAERAAVKKAERLAAAPKVEISAIEALFSKAVENDIKRPIFRAEGIEISRAAANGRNPGALYVKRNGEYAGKIVGGQFHKVYAAAADTVDLLMAIAADPTAAAMKYGRKMGTCGCCGRELVDPVSIRAGVGPICSEKWGLDFQREMAREQLNQEREDEQ